TFVHDLVRHTVYEELESKDRARLHRQAAEVLEVTYGPVPSPVQASEIATQYHHSAALPGAERGVEPSPPPPTPRRPAATTRPPPSCASPSTCSCRATSAAPASSGGSASSWPGRWPSTTPYRWPSRPARRSPKPSGPTPPPSTWPRRVTCAPWPAASSRRG